MNRQLSTTTKLLLDNFEQKSNEYFYVRDRGTTAAEVEGAELAYENSKANLTQHLMIHEPSEQMDRVIVCAANRYVIPATDSTGEIDLVVLGSRHWDAHMRMHAYRMCALGLIPHVNVQWVQGFMDNREKFLNRTDAWHVATAAGQIRRRVGGDDINGGTLFSENLY